MAISYSPRRLRPSLVATAVVGALALGGCATFSKDGGLDPVARTAKDRLGADLKWVRTPEQQRAVDDQVAELLGHPLSADDAVQLALINNRGLQASFQELGIAEADLVQASRLPNPNFTLRRSSLGGLYNIEQTLTINILALATIPLARQVEQRRFIQVQRAVAIEVLQLANETRKAYYNAIAADQTVRYMQQVRTAAEASADLAKQMVQAGNWNRLNQAREQGFYADATQGLARAQLNQAGTREDLLQRLGLWGKQTAITLPDRLPDLPKAIDDLPNVEQTAMNDRLDLQMARAEVDAVAKNLGLTNATRFINVLELGPTRELDGPKSDPYKKGFEVTVSVPIFDWGSAKVAKAESIYMQAVNRAAQTAVNARSEVRKRYLTYRTTYDIARHQRDEVVPTRKLIADENQLRYNGMLIGVFDLLADARSQIASVNDYIQAARDYWIAKSDLDTALIGNASPTTPASGMGYGAQAMGVR